MIGPWYELKEMVCLKSFVGLCWRTQFVTQLNCVSKHKRLFLLIIVLLMTSVGCKNTSDIQYRAFSHAEPLTGI